MNLIMTRISNFSVFLLNLVTSGFFIHYMYELLQEKGVTAQRRYKAVVYGCLLVNLLILVSNVATKWMYYFDDMNLYHRNTGWYVYTLISLVNLLTGSVMCLRYRRAVSRTMLFALLFYALAPVMAIIVQTFIYGISITNIGIFTAMILMLLAYLREWSSVRERDENKRKALEMAILFIIMTISMSASVMSCILSIKRLSTKNSQSSSMMIAHMVSDGIEKEFLRPIVVSETMANDYSLKQYMKKSASGSPEDVADEIAAYLDSIRTGFGYQMVFAVCDESKAYYTCNGITKYVDVEKNEHDIWYQLFLDQVERGKQYDLDVDTDEANQWALSVFVNSKITDEDGKLLGVCGVCVDMTDLQKLLSGYEETYDVKINLIDMDGLIQVDSDAERIERDCVSDMEFPAVDAKEFTYEQGQRTSRMMKFMEDLDWYLLVEDNNPEKIQIAELIFAGIIILFVGLLMMAIVFCVIYIREKKARIELTERKNLSVTDDLTGLFNRRAYEEDCAEIAQFQAISEITLAMMDVNGLKAVNDTYGHLAGDELIIGAAKCMLTAVGDHGKVYRIGGDEFVALLRCSEQELSDMLHTLEHLIQRWNETHKSELTISKGIVVAAQHGKLSLPELSDLADKLMYEDKEKYYRQTGKVRRK